MSERPPIEPEVVAKITDNVPARLIRKLDANPGLAETWQWSTSDAAVQVDTGREQVKLGLTNGRVAELADASCSCLLSPRCLHLLAVISVLPAAPAACEEVGEVPPPASDGQESALISDSQRAAAQRAQAAAAEVLAAGASGAGAILQGELLRAVHTCRAEGLFRLAMAGTRVVYQARLLRARDRQADLAAFAADLRDLLLTARMLAGETASPLWLGTARRRFSAATGLRLVGLFSEPVLTSSGYAGVVTWLVDQRARLLSVNDVQPGDADRVAPTYRAAAQIGECVLPHQQLCRDSLLLERASVSADGRLGRGAAVKAVRSGPSEWTDEAPAALFARQPGAQIESVCHQLERPPDARPGGWDLLFLRAVIRGQAKGSLVLEAEGLGAIHCRPPPALHAALPSAENLRVLAGAVGGRVLAVVRVLPERPRVVNLLALGPVEDGPVVLPGKWHGRINLGLDHLQRGNITGPGETLEMAGASSFIDPLEPLRRRLERMALGGSTTLPDTALSAVEGEARAFEHLMMPGAAAAVRAMVRAARGQRRALTGRHGEVDAQAVAEAWLAAAIYELTAARELYRRCW